MTSHEHATPPSHADITASLTRLDEHRIRVNGQGPIDASVWGNGWETEINTQGAFAFNCMAYTDGSVGLLVRVNDGLWSADASVLTLAVGDTITAGAFVRLR